MWRRVLGLVVKRMLCWSGFVDGFGVEMHMEVRHDVAAGSMAAEAAVVDVEVGK